MLRRIEWRFAIGKHSINLLLYPLVTLLIREQKVEKTAHARRRGVGANNNGQSSVCNNILQRRFFFLQSCFVRLSNQKEIR